MQTDQQTCTWLCQKNSNERDEFPAYGKRSEVRMDLLLNSNLEIFLIVRNNNNVSRLIRFQAAIKEYGVPQEEIFQTADLFERRNIPQVTLCLYALGRIVSYQTTSNFYFFRYFIL